MKKNAMLKIAAILLVAVLLTTCAISATFAKYVTSAAMREAAEARVAMWGVTATITSDNAFAEVYEKDSTVVVDADDLVVAPGTTNASAITVSIDATKAEVEYEIESTFHVELGDKWMLKDGVTTYFPVIFMIDNTPINYVVDDGSGSTRACTDIADYEKAIDDAINNAIKATKDTDGDDVVIGWKWLAGDANQNDTDLGNAAAEGNAATISINGGVTITQVATDSAVAQA